MTAAHRPVIRMLPSALQVCYECHEPWPCPAQRMADSSIARMFWCRNCDETWGWTPGQVPSTHVCKLLQCECCGREDI